MTPLSLMFGALVGLSLGLTGGGGAIFAVPLLVYGLHVPAKEAVAVSLAAVGATSFVGFLDRWRAGQVELRTGLLFAVAGMFGAPLGTWLARFLPEPLLLLAFAGLMVLVAWRLWKAASASGPVATSAMTASDGPQANDACAADLPTCRRDAQGRLLLNSRCAALLLAIGVGTGVLSGLFGVGGGFVIVPALVLFSGMSIHRAVGTSLMVVALVSVSGIAAQLVAGRTISPSLTLTFIAGGILGLFAGRQIGRKLSGAGLQKVFAVAILLTAVFVIVRNFQH